MLEWNDYVENKFFNLPDLVRDEDGLRIDPYLVWAYTTGFSYVDVEERNHEKLLPVIIELKEIYSNLSNQHKDILDNLLDGWDYLPFHQFFPSTKYITAKVPESIFFSFLQSEEKTELVERFELGLTATSTFDLKDLGSLSANIFSEGFARFSSQPDVSKIPLGLPTLNGSSSPIVGIIDDDIAFLNQRFQYSNRETRIHFLWDQNTDSIDTDLSDAAEAPDATDRYGRFYTKNNIDTLISECYGADLTYPIMEDLIYSREGKPNLARAVSHGTHLLDVIAGQDPEYVTSHEEIVAVELPQPDRRFSDTSGNWLKVSIFQALQFLILAAEGVASLTPDNTSAKERDLFVNLSFGNFAGPHDGSSVLERGIDFLIESAPELKYLKSLSVNIAAGNQRQSQCYANASVSKDDPLSFHWRVLPDDSTPSFMEIWFEDSTDLENLGVKIKPPLDTRLGSTRDVRFSVGAGSCTVLSDTAKGIPICTYVSLPKSRNATGDRAMALIVISPTSLTSDYLLAPAGMWEIEISNESSTPCEIRAWIQRDDSRSGNPIRARQSYFSDPEYRTTDKMGYPATPKLKQLGYVSQQDTVNGIATGKHVTTVGADRYSGRRNVDYSGYKKELLEDESNHRFLDAVAEDSLTNPGVIASGSKSGSRVSLNGTSVANAVATKQMLKTAKDTKRSRRVPIKR